MSKDNFDTDIIVLGTGVSGVTTAVTLQLLGYRTKLVGDRFIHEDSGDDQISSLFASRYPAASIIPHSVNSDRLEVLFKDSQQLFRALHEADHSFIRQNRHYEWYRYPVDLPGYRDWMDDFCPIDAREDLRFPSSLGNQHAEQTIFGWSFKCFFVDWPLYASQLFNWYSDIGGECIKRHLTRQDIRDLDAPLLINCTGARSRQLFEDREDFCFLLGKSLIIKDAPKIDTLSSITTYNFTPGAEIYSHSSGCPVDLYCYPRNSGWVLGGSRLHGHIDAKGRWKGEQWTGRMLSIDKQQIPAPIYEINRELIQHLYEIDIENYTLQAKSGYRFMRDSKTDGLRLEEDQQHGKTVIHNYGHGGAGVTLSWGSALQVARMIRNHTLPSGENGNTLPSSLQDVKRQLQGRL